MATFFMVAAVIVGITGCITIYIMARPLLQKQKEKAQMIIPLAEIASVWILHNKEVAPVKPGQVGEETGDALDSLFAKAKQKVEAEAKTEAKAEGQAPQAPWAANDSRPVITTPEKPTKEESTSAPQEKPTQVSPAAARPILNKEQLQQAFNSLWKDCIEPYTKLIVEAGADNVINDLLRLLEEHGHCPSIVISSHDNESMDLLTVRDNLAKVTLRDHTYAVCRNMIALVQEHYGNADPIIPNALIVSLGHDIGKIPELRLSGAYNSEEHCLVSGDKVAELMAASNIPWKDRTIPTIKNHHSTTKDDLTNLLKKADQSARQAELITFTKNLSIKPFKDWFNVRKYMTEYVAPEVNSVVGKGWNAFSWKGTIYAYPDWLYEKGQLMCGNEHALDLTFKYESQKDDAIRLIMSALRTENLTPLLSDNFTSRPFEIRTSVESVTGKNKKYYLSAITIPEYIDQVQMESRKSGFAQIINAVIPVKK